MATAPQRESSVNGRLPDNYRAGSRKYHRWLNKNFLYQQNVELSAGHELDFSVKDASSVGTFSKLFEEEHKHLIDLFLKHHDQNLAKDKPKHFDRSSPKAAYLNIDKSIRKLIRQLVASGAEFFSRMDKDMLSFIQNTTNQTSNTYYFQSSMDRVLAHALCSYYGLKSNVQDTSFGRSFTIIIPQQHIYPSVSLTSYVQLLLA